MRVGIDEPRQHDLAGGIDDEIATRHGDQSVHRSTATMSRPSDHHPPVLDDSVRAVHRENEPVLDRNARHRKRPSPTAVVRACTLLSAAEPAGRVA